LPSTTTLVGVVSKVDGVTASGAVGAPPQPAVTRAAFANPSHRRAAKARDLDVTQTGISSNTQVQCWHNVTRRR
jgi:hypothetical protein